MIRTMTRCQTFLSLDTSIVPSRTPYTRPLYARMHSSSYSWHIFAGGHETAVWCGVSFRTQIINTSYQKLPLGAGDYPDKLLFHQALN